MLKVKSVKLFPELSEETQAFSCSLYWNGKNVGTVTNRGRGGCNQYTWNNPVLGRKIMEWAEDQDVEYPDFEALDQVIDRLMVEAQIDKELKKQCKNKTLIRLVGDSTLVNAPWRVYATPYNLTIKNALVKKFGSSLLEIANERYFVKSSCNTFETSLQCA